MNRRYVRWCEKMGALKLPLTRLNTDQGVQYTCESFLNILLERGIRPSMDGRWRAIDNVFIERLWRSVKYEDIFIKDYENGEELYFGLKKIFFAL